jgi:undecaprenyl-diphosphatase
MRALTWLGLHEFGMLVTVALIASGIWFFVEVADEVREGDTQTIDRQLMLALRSRTDPKEPLGPRWVEVMARDITALGGSTVLVLLTLSVCGFLVLNGKRRTAIFIIAAIASGIVISTFLKRGFDRPRPDLVPHGVYVTTTSFPSGHSMMSALTYLTLGALLATSQQSKRVKAYLLLWAVFLTIIVGISRVYLGVHWPSDVLAGWTAGSVWALMCWMISRRLQQRHTIEREQEHSA